MTPYQRAAAVSSAPRTTATASAPVPLRRWPRVGDRVGQVVLQSSVAVVLAAMVVNRLGAVPLGGGAPAGSVRTWQLDALALVLLGALGVGHSLLRRGRPGRWSVAALALLLPAVVVLAPGWG
ncbi:hypothetical protein SAMN05660199_01255 [Klenkia soli]|uniref:Uncharacterized protein n=1 Tax=Klenkia soli TaxID=1052260 RepID=A0A1H0GIN1_9ACTN|nr:hypothetical protein [Klenkia soli]SDO06797.1 hypothetical protein SAMN05660199_01255 [Klenkia soli]